MKEFTRESSVDVFDIAESASMSDAVDVSQYAGGLIVIPSSWTAAGISFHVGNTSGGTFFPVYDANDALVEIAAVSASRAYQIPVDVFGARYLKIQSQTAGTPVNQAAARDITVFLKA